MQSKEKAIKTGELTPEEIEGLTDDDLMSLYHTMKRHADFAENKIDFKHAMHLVRLLRMGVEALRDEEIVVKRPDALELLEIRAGAWTYEEIVEYAEKMDKEVREVWYKKTSLPKHPDLKFAAALLMDAQDSIWYG